MSDRARYPTADSLPRRIPVFPLSGALLLPRAQLPLNIFEPRYLAMVDDALSGDRIIGMIQPEEEADDAVARQRASPHGEITRLEDVERRLGARQDRAPLKGNTGMRRGCRPWAAPLSCRSSWSTHENRIEDRRLRPATVNSSFGPQASKNLTSGFSGIVVPVALPADNAEKVAVERLLAPVRGIEGDGEIVTGLVVGGVLLDRLRQAGDSRRYRPGWRPARGRLGRW